MRRVSNELLKVARELVGASDFMLDIEFKAKTIADRINKASKVLQVNYEIEEKPNEKDIVIYFRAKIKEDPYVRSDGGVSVTNKYVKEMELMCMKAFGERIGWNNMETTGWVFVSKEN